MPADLANKVLRSRAVRSLVSTLENTVPGLRAWHRFEYEQQFAQTTSKARMFSGVYDTFQAALHAVADGARIGYDNPEVADRHSSEVGHVWPSDYPVLFWMSSLLRENARVFDLGGAVGVSFYGFQERMEYPVRMTWTVCDVPAVAKCGREIARQKHAMGLSFTSSFSDCDGADILLASGSLMYIEKSLPVLLAALSSKPKHVLVNRAAFCEGPAFVTLQNIGQAICPYQIRNQREFIREFEETGYTLVDSWDAPEFSCYIPFHPERSVRAYRGMYFRLREGGGAEGGAKSQ